MSLNIHVRWMIRRDMPEMLEIEAKAFDYPWSEEDFVRVLRNRQVIGMVAECGEKIGGYMIYELHKTRLHVLNFAVHYDYRRQGVGTALFRKLVSKLSDAVDRRHKIMLEVRETNLDAQNFFRAMGMKAVSLLRNFYEQVPNEDAYLMQYRYAKAETCV